MVVHACADQAKKMPSMADEMELYNLTADPYETTDVRQLAPLMFDRPPL